MNLITLFTLINLVNCLQQPLIQRERIAIIGAGAGGSSTSYHLQKFSSHSFDINIFETNSYVGGRSTTINNHNNEINSTIELGASIFVKSNKILYDAVEFFNLSLKNHDFTEKYPEKFNGSLGIWNGTDFIYRSDSKSNNFIEIGKLFWNYGLSPLKTYRLLKSTLKKFIDNYYTNDFPFKDLNEITSDSGLLEFTNQTGLDVLNLHGINDGFKFDLIEPATRVNYRSNLDEIHGLETLVSIAADENPVQVIGGNFKIFEKFIEFSHAELNLNTKVTHLSYDLISDSWDVTSQTVSDGETITKSERFNHVIIASPFHQAEINITGVELYEEINQVEYRDLYVTYLETDLDHLIDNERYFQTKNIPEFILTQKNNQTPFFSINLVDYDEITNKVIYKIFSPQKITTYTLSTYLFNEFDQTKTKIFFNKIWKPYPKLVNIDEFNQFEIGPKLWYLNTIEQFISTMETSALAGANVASFISLGKNSTEIKL